MTSLSGMCELLPENLEIVERPNCNCIRTESQEFQAEVTNIGGKNPDVNDLFMCTNILSTRSKPMSVSRPTT